MQNHPIERLKAVFSPSKLACKPKTIMGALAGATVLALAAPAISAPVTLRAKDGTFNLYGEILSFDGENYRIDSIIGEMVVNARQVECEGSSCPSEEKLSTEFAISGAGGVVNNLLPALLTKYSTGLNADLIATEQDSFLTNYSVETTDGERLASIDLKSGSAQSGLTDIFNDDAVLAVTDRSVATNEVERFRRAGKGNLTSEGQEILLALDGLLVVAAPSNPVGALSTEEIAGIFAGRITNWAQLGGPNAEINVYSRPADSGTGEVLDQLVLDPNGVQQSRAVTILDSDQAVSDAVAADPFGVGISSFSAQNEAKAIDIRGTCGIVTPASQFTIKTEEYPLSRRLLMYRPDVEASAQVNDFIDFVGSTEAQQIVAAEGYVDQGIDLVRSENQGLRYATAMWPTDAETNLRELGEMVQELLPAERVSLTYRFEFGSSALDARSLRDIQRLADLIAGGEEFKNKELLLVGFTDSFGKAVINRNLSVIRAQAVERALQSVALPGSLDTTPIRVMGYGEMSPLSCNDTENGRQINRRVEVWVREIIRS